MNRPRVSCTIRIYFAVALAGLGCKAKIERDTSTRAGSSVFTNGEPPASAGPVGELAAAPRPKRDPSADSFAKMQFSYGGAVAKAWPFMPDISENQAFANSKPNLFLWDTGTKPASEKPDAPRLFAATPDATKVRLAVTTNADVQGVGLVGVGALFPTMTKAELVASKKFKAGTMPNEVAMSFTKDKNAQLFGEVTIAALDVAALDVAALDIAALDVAALDVAALDVAALDVAALDVAAGIVESTFAGQAKIGSEAPIAIENGSVWIHYSGK
jgi:hypothetical protein